MAGKSKSTERVQSRYGYVGKNGPFQYITEKGRKRWFYTNYGCVMNYASASCKDSCQCKEWEDTGVKRPRNKVTISNINTGISKFRTNVFTDFASTSHSCEQNLPKFPLRTQWK